MSHLFTSLLPTASLFFSSSTYPPSLPASHSLPLLPPYLLPSSFLPQSVIFSHSPLRLPHSHTYTHIHSQSHSNSQSLPPPPPLYSTGILCPLLYIFAEYMNDIPVTILLLLLAFMGCLVGGPNNIITSAVAADLADDLSIKGNNKVYSCFNRAFVKALV